MKKHEAIRMLLAARSAHIQWRARAQALVAGVPLDESQIPVVYTDCKFGQWYYGAGQQKLGELESFRALEAPHEQLHLSYMEIFNLLFGQDDRSLLHKFFGSKQKRHRKQVEAARAILPRLVGISQDLLDGVDRLESELQAMSPEEFDAL